MLSARMIEGLIGGQPDQQSEIVGRVVHGERERRGASNAENDGREQPTTQCVEAGTGKHWAAGC
jgi:hypothetical protein